MCLLLPLGGWLLIRCHTGAMLGWVFSGGGSGWEGSVTEPHSAQNPPANEELSLLS